MALKTWKGLPKIGLHKKKKKYTMNRHRVTSIVNYWNTLKNVSVLPPCKRSPSDMIFTSIQPYEWSLRGSAIHRSLFKWISDNWNKLLNKGRGMEISSANCYYHYYQYSGIALTILFFFCCCFHMKVKAGFSISLNSWTGIFMSILLSIYQFY